MKLYATVQSERATKGQGGQKHLNIAIHIDEEYPRYRLFVTKRDDDSTDVVLVDLEKPFPNTVFEDKIKGEKKKGEPCQWCNAQGCFHCDYTRMQ